MLQTAPHSPHYTSVPLWSVWTNVTIKMISNLKKSSTIEKGTANRLNGLVGFMCNMYIFTMEVRVNVHP